MYEVYYRSKTSVSTVKCADEQAVLENTIFTKHK
jgi:hypothetical protein